MSEDSISDPAPAASTASAAGNPLPSSPQPQPSASPPLHRGRGGRNRGRWRQPRNREEAPTEPVPECLNIAELRQLPLKSLQKRVAEQGGDGKAATSQELVHQLLKLHCEKNGLWLAEGILEISRGGFGFLRCTEVHYQPRPEDPYLAPALIRRFALQVGDRVVGMARPPRERERYPTLLHVDLIWEELPEKIKNRKPYDELTPLYPQQRLVLETGADSIGMRALDLLAPLGRGQRCLLVAPPRAGKTILLQQIAQGIEKNDPDMNVVVLLVDERPEEVDNMRRAIKGEVISSTFDESMERHLRVTDLVVEKVHRMIETGRHVILLLDSLTRLARACNATASSKGRLMSGGVESGALLKPRKIFSAARNVEEGGSLTIVATILVETGSRMDDLIFEEFKGTGNMEVHLSRDLQERRIYPAIHIEKTGTRREELLYHPDEYVRILALRRQLMESPPLEAMEKLIDMLMGTDSNAELLMRTKLE